MDYKVIWVDEAELEILVAIDWYNEKRIGLGYDLVECVDVALLALNRHPFISIPVSDNVRRVLIRRFPYGLYYRVIKNVIEVVGFRHFRQNTIKSFKKRSAT